MPDRPSKLAGIDFPFSLLGSIRRAQIGLRFSAAIRPYAAAKGAGDLSKKPNVCWPLIRAWTQVVWWALSGLFGKKREIVESLLELYKRLRGEKPKDAKKVDGNNVELTLRDGNKVVVNNNVFHLHSDPVIVKDNSLTSQLSALTRTHAGSGSGAGKRMKIVVSCPMRGRPIWSAEARQELTGRTDRQLQGPDRA
jgi:hypothetical protein